MKPISILLVHENLVFLDLLAKFVGDIRRPEVGAIQTCAQYDRVLEVAGELNPHLVLHDVGLPNLLGLPSIARLREELPNVNIIALISVFSSRFKAEAFRSGASDVIYTGSIFWDLEPLISRLLQKDGRKGLRQNRAAAKKRCAVEVMK